MDFLWNNFAILLLYIVLLTIFIFYIGDQLAIYAEQLSVVTGISGAFIGFVLIAMITSIPEMVSTFVSVRQGLYGLSAGGVFGSNAINVAILSAIFLIFRDKKVKISNSSIFSFLASLILLGFVGLVVCLYPISSIVPSKSLVGVVFVFLYVFIMKHAYDLSGHQEDEETQVESKFSTVKIVLLFTLLSIAIIVSAWGLVAVCKLMSEVPLPIYGKPLGQHFIGTLILAFSTSVPELATSFQIVRRGNTDMAVENISGSNIFNLLVLVMASFFTTSNFWSELPLNSIYTIFMIFILSLLMCVVGLVKESKKNTIGIYILIIALWMYSLVVVF